MDGHDDHDAVASDLDWLFSAQPVALVLVDNCRRDAGPFVQWGIGEFLTKAGDGAYRFHLLADLSFGLAGSNLGIYPGTGCGVVPLSARATGGESGQAPRPDDAARTGTGAHRPGPAVSPTRRTGTTQARDHPGQYHLADHLTPPRRVEQGPPEADSHLGGGDPSRYPEVLSPR